MDVMVFEEEDLASEKAVRFMTIVISFLSEVQTIVRDLKLIGSKMGPINKRVVNAYTKLQDKHSPYEDVIKGARDMRNWMTTLSTNELAQKPKKLAQEETLPKDAVKLQEEIRALQRQLKEKNTDLAKKNEYISFMNKKHRDLVARLPRGGEVNQDSEAADLSGQNLTQHVCAEYRSLVDGDWKAAVAELTPDDNVSKDDTYKYLCSILMISADVAKKKYDEFIAPLKEHLKCLRKPLVTMQDRNPPNQKQSKSKEKAEAAKQAEQGDVSVPQSVQMAVEDYVRATSHTIDVAVLYEETLNAMDENASKYYDIHKVFKKQIKSSSIGPALRKYIENACALSWKMAAQTPEAIFKLFKTGLGNPFDERVQERHKESDDQPDAQFQFYVFPVLMQAHKPNTLLIKGSVMYKAKK